MTAKEGSDIQLTWLEVRGRAADDHYDINLELIGAFCTLHKINQHSENGIDNLDLQSRKFAEKEINLRDLMDEQMKKQEWVKCSSWIQLQLHAPIRFDECRFLILHFGLCLAHPTSAWKNRYTDEAIVVDRLLDVNEPPTIGECIRPDSKQNSNEGPAVFESVSTSQYV